MVYFQIKKRYAGKKADKAAKPIVDALVPKGSINLTDQGQLPENFGTIPGGETSESSSKLDSSPKGLIAPSLDKFKKSFFNLFDDL